MQNTEATPLRLLSEIKAMLLRPFFLPQLAGCSRTKQNSRAPKVSRKSPISTRGIAHFNRQMSTLIAQGVYGELLTYPHRLAFEVARTHRVLKLI